MCMVWCQCVYVTNNQALPSHLLCHYCSDGREEDWLLLMVVTRPTSAYTGLNRGAVYNRFFLVYNAFKYQPGWLPQLHPLFTMWPLPNITKRIPLRILGRVSSFKKLSSNNSLLSSFLSEKKNGWKLGSGVRVEDKRMYTMENWNRENTTTTDGIERVRKWR